MITITTITFLGICLLMFGLGMLFDSTKARPRLRLLVTGIGFFILAFAVESMVLTIVLDLTGGILFWQVLSYKDASGGDKPTDRNKKSGP